MKTLYLIDAFAIIYRAYYAHERNPLHNSSGADTSVPYGFLQVLREVLHREQPTHIGAAFDVGGENFRHLIYPAYKANRRETPEVIQQSLPVLHELLAALRIPVLKLRGYEADDIIGTMAHMAQAAGFTVYMMTPDKDYGQLVSPSIYIYKPPRRTMPAEKLGVDDICRRYGIAEPQQVRDVLALWGDSSDNIPGAPGIGEKGAMRLVAQYGSLENIIARAQELPPRQRDSILQNEALLRRAKELVTIDTAVPIPFDEEALRRKEPNREQLQSILTQLEFRSMLRYFCGTDATENSTTTEPSSTTLFNDNLQGSSNGIYQAGTSAFTRRVNDVLPDANSIVYQAGTSAFTRRVNDVLQDGNTTSVAAAKNISTQPISRNSTTTAHTYHIVSSNTAAAALAEQLNSAATFCFDTETTGTNPMEDDIVGMSFSMKAGEAYYVPLNNDNRNEYLDILRPVLENSAIAKIGQNIKFDYLVLKSCGIRVQGFLFDTMLLHYLLAPEDPHNMDYLARTYLNYEPIPIEALIGRKGKQQSTMRDVPLHAIAEYAAEDADITYQLYEKLYPLIVENGFETLYANVEAPLLVVLAEMEWEGVCLDSAALQALRADMAAQAAQLEADIRTMAGEPSLNVFSPKQLGEALFNKMKIGTGAHALTKSGQFSTSEETLAALRHSHPIVPKILEVRSVKKLLSSYVDSLPALVSVRTGRIHTSFHQAVTSTGRLSSSNPNLQNIPIREAQGREIRKAFVPSTPNHVLLAADYSQVELRLMAHLSGDRNLIDAFLRGEDVHSATAAKIYGVPLPQVTSAQRRNAKTANFGIIYGISAFGLSQKLEIPRTEARTLIDGYFAAYPRVRTYMDEIVAQARRNGYVTTLCGRRRMLTDINSHNSMERGFAERNAINAPIQGSAADIVKIAMLRIAAAITANSMRTRMLLQVHDELVFDVPKDELNAITTIVKHEMENAYVLQVPLLVDVNHGSNWLEAH